MELDKANHRGAATKNAEFVEWLLRGDGRGRFVCLRPTTRVIPVDLAFYCVEFETQSLLSCKVDSILIQVNSKVFLILPLISDVVQSQFICVIHAAMGCKDMMLLSDCATREEERGMMCLKSSQLSATAHLRRLGA